MKIRVHSAKGAEIEVRVRQRNVGAVLKVLSDAVSSYERAEAAKLRLAAARLAEKR